VKFTLDPQNALFLSVRPRRCRQIQNDSHSSSFPRKRESRAAAPTFVWPLDPRFRGGDDDITEGATVLHGQALISFKEAQTWRNDPDELDGQLVDDDNLVAEMARRAARARAKSEAFPPVLIRAIRLRCGLSQRDAGALFGTGAKSFETYEVGQIPPSKPTRRLRRLAMERPDLFTKPVQGEGKMPEAADIRLIRGTIRQARLDRLYARRSGTARGMKRPDRSAPRGPPRAASPVNPRPRYAPGQYMRHRHGSIHSPR
jgi:HTH-type transcriptional regulator/antitoxin MqsA